MNIREEYHELEKKLYPIIEILEEKKNTPEYKGLYKGITTLFGPLIQNPEILFIGVNPSSGAWEVANKNKDTNITPLRMLGKDETLINGKLDWLEKNTSRIHKYEWYQRDKNINNIFPARIIDLIYQIAKLKYPEIETNNYEKPPWANDIFQ